MTFTLLLLLYYYYCHNYQAGDLRLLTQQDHERRQQELKHDVAV